MSAWEREQAVYEWLFYGAASVLATAGLGMLVLGLLPGFVHVLAMISGSLAGAGPGAVTWLITGIVCAAGLAACCALYGVQPTAQVIAELVYLLLRIMIILFVILLVVDVLRWLLGGNRDNCA